ncbi:hypothetical protein GCM10023331_11300 [Algivirga pacifica]|uniref:Uncharacterized protein n=2 Tax=Algivirga pacifica TaxID=1162670 RepID=A0ABP9D5E6_9BACT
MALLLFINFMFFKPIASGFIQFINANIGPAEKVLVKGKVVQKIDSRMNHVLIVREHNSGITYELNTLGNIVKQRHNKFREEMCVGSLGLLYLKN